MLPVCVPGDIGTLELEYLTSHVSVSWYLGRFHYLLCMKNTMSILSHNLHDGNMQ